MATQPQFAGTPKVGRATWTASSTANTRSDGVGTIGTDMLLLLTAGAAGTFVDRIRLIPTATTASTATTATVARIYLSTQSSGATTSANTVLWQEVALPSQTADAPTAAVSPVEIATNFRIASGVNVLISYHHAAAANTVWQATALGMDY